MQSEPLLVRLPDDLLRRFKQFVPSRKRSAFVQQLIERALPAADNDPLYQAALAVEQEEQLAEEMAEWDAATTKGGLTRLRP